VSRTKTNTHIQNCVEEGDQIVTTSRWWQYKMDVKEYVNIMWI